MNIRDAHALTVKAVDAQIDSIREFLSSEDSSSILCQMHPIDSLFEIRTLRVGLPRSRGNTEIIRRIAAPGDLLLVLNEQRARYMGADMDCEVMCIDRFSNSRRGAHTTYNIIWIDEEDVLQKIDHPLAYAIIQSLGESGIMVVVGAPRRAINSPLTMT